MVNVKVFADKQAAKRANGQTDGQTDVPKLYAPDLSIKIKA